MSSLDTQDQDLEYTRDIRKQIVSSLIKKGIPEDPKEKTILLQTLDGIDRAALTQKRIKSDEGMSNAKAQAAATLAELFMDPRLKQVGAVIDVESRVMREMPQLGNDLEEPLIVDGELGNGGGETYDSFTARIGLNKNVDDGEEIYRD